MGPARSLLGLALGAVQPMIMTTLHQITPDDRHGEAIALRSMTINFSSAVMPLLFGLAGAALGAASLFWVMGAAVGGGQPLRHAASASDALTPAARQNLMPPGRRRRRVARGGRLGVSALRRRAGARRRRDAPHDAAWRRAYW